MREIIKTRVGAIQKNRRSGFLKVDIREMLKEIKHNINIYVFNQEQTIQVQ